MVVAVVTGLQQLPPDLTAVLRDQVRDRPEPSPVGERPPVEVLVADGLVRVVELAGVAP